MQMKMKNDLPTSSFDIKKEFISGLFYSVVLGHAFSYPEHAGKDHAVLFGQVVYTPDVFPGNHQKVNRGMWMDILEDNDIGIFVYKLSRGAAFEDSAENAMIFHLPVSPF
jgi:hypothetical protein